MSKIKQLIEKGVRIPNPQSVEIGDDVDVDRISSDSVTIYSGSKIYGRESLILQGAQLGYESPVTIENCYIGPQVELKGGYFKQAAFLNQAKMGSGAHVRQGTILEEQASCAHTVGLKMTILMPFVTLGSLINFCDCLMAGGTGPKDHSEVGSSYIHFNFTPNQDKATASLIGDVPNGVMLDQAPIFLGGQGGLVGPARLAYGTIIAAGSIYRKDELQPGLLLFEGGGRGGKIPFTPGLYRSLKRAVLNNVVYIGNLIALRQWYGMVRREFVGINFPEELLSGLTLTAERAIAERIKQLKGLSEKLPRSIRLYKDALGENAGSLLLSQKDEFVERWTDVEGCFEELTNFAGDLQYLDHFLTLISPKIKENKLDYIATVQSFDGKIKDLGRQWLTSIVVATISRISTLLPSFGMTP